MATAEVSRLETIRSDIANRYPRPVTLSGGAKIELKLMGDGDRASVLAFARALPPDDLLFLRTNITEEPVVRDWVANIEAGRSVSVLAYAGGSVAGYATLHLEAAHWMRHLGEIRVQAASGYRGQGLGRLLAGEIFALGRLIGLRKLTAQMTLDQAGARATFERLGFKPEALLTDFVMTADGRTRDLLIMAYDLDGLNDTVDA
ncbi:MAG: GNAT family N-acetyltransferase [Chloroflexi bacterium]|nr:GNAT family N-acetyltransferase [Chloroflexota bacterium]